MPIRAKFTALTINSLPEGLHFDERLPGFGIRVQKTRKTWLVVKGPNRTKVTLGHYPSLSLQEARRKALVALGSPYEPIAAPTFPEALEAYLAQPRWKPRSKYVMEQSLKHFPWKRPLDKITHEDVAQVLDGITAHSSRAHALKDIRAFFNWCVPRYLKQSPCDGLKMPSYVPRQRVLSGNELAQVWRAAEEIGYPFGTILQLLILTGQRKSEISTLQWEQIRGTSIFLPETKNGQAHQFPIGPMTEALIATVPRVSRYLFPARNTEGSYGGFGPAKARFDKHCLLPAWTLHDLRRTFASNLAQLGTPIHVTEKILNHVSGTTSGIVSVYQVHSYWEEQVTAVGRWERRLAQLLNLEQ